MYDRLNIIYGSDWDGFVRDAASSDGIILFGARKGADMVYDPLMDSGIGIRYLVDTSADLQKKKWKDRYEVKPETALGLCNSDDILFVTSEYYVQICDIIQEAGFTGKVYLYFFMKNRKYEFYEKTHTDHFEKNFDRVNSLMTDQRSKDIFRSILEKRKNGNTDYRDIMEDNQYFQEGVISKREDAFFVDAGSYNGDTIQEFIDYSEGSFKKILGFEIDESNIDMMPEKLKADDRIKVLKVALWDKDEALSFVSADVGGHITEESCDNKVEGKRLDDLVGEDERVTFIKMDIEGAEINALNGARKTIQRCSPDLAICVYHNPDDMIDIPLLINSFNPEYRFCLRHHDKAMVETVLYAKVP